MQGALDAGAVVFAEDADMLDDHLQIRRGNLMFAEHHFAVAEARFGQAAQVHDNFQQVTFALGLFERLGDAFG